MFASCGMILILMVAFPTSVSGGYIFTCDDGKTMNTNRFCNEYLDCADGSDETSVEVLKNETDIRAEYLRCVLPRTLGMLASCAIRRAEYCKGQIQCNGKSLCDGWCPDHYQCPDKTCLRRSTVCDGDICNDCLGYRRWDNGHGFKCLKNGRTCILPQVLLFDGIADCDDGTDLCYLATEGNLTGDPRNITGSPGSSFNTSSCFLCNDEQRTIIHRSGVCDNVIDCPDLSDECQCEGETPVICRHVTAYQRNPTLIKRCNCFDADGVCHNHLTQNAIHWCVDDEAKRCNFTSLCSMSIKCDQLCPSHFRCPDRTCLQRSTVCDGDTCNDCPSSQLWENGHGFKCVKDGKSCLLPQVLIFDGIRDCDEGEDLCFIENQQGGHLLKVPSDIRGSSFAKFNSSLCFRCYDNTTIISKSSVCNNVVDCPDMSDECFCGGKTPKVCGHVTSYQTLPSLVQQCKCFDDFGVCLNYLDDNGAAEPCKKTKRELCEAVVYPCGSQVACDLECPTHFRCPDMTCLSRSTVCDDSTCNDCWDHERWNNGHGFKCVRNGRACKLPQMLVWDGVKDCDAGQDLCYVDPAGRLLDYPSDIRSSVWAKFNETLCFACLNGTLVIPRTSVCDDIIDCADLSDECLCEGRLPEICKQLQPNKKVRKLLPNCTTGIFFCDKGNCITRQAVCDGRLDCEDGSDENSTLCGGTIPCSNTTLPGTDCRCMDLAAKTCIQKTATFCDGRRECVTSPGDGQSYNALASDECTERCPEIVRNGLNAGRKNKTKLCTKPQTSSLFECADRGFSSKANSMSICDGRVECNDGYIGDYDYFYGDEDPELCTWRKPCDTVDGLVNLDELKLCDGFVDCKDGSDENKNSCPGRVYCSTLGGAAVSISEKQVCDHKINCDNAEDELNCTDDGRFYCENKQPLFVHKRKVFNSVGDCSDWSDECPSITSAYANNVFSSRYELIANPLLRAVVWIMAITAIIGNSVVFAEEIKYLTRFQRLSASSRANHLLVLNLSISDFLMGVYLVMLGAAGVRYSGIYCSNDLSWRSSVVCTTMGVLATLSSEASVLTMVLLTTFRFYAVYKPFKASTNPSLWLVICAIVLTWFSSCLISFLPLAAPFQEAFETKAWINDNTFFRGVVVELSEMKTMLGRLTMLYPMLNATNQGNKSSLATSWGDLYNLLDENRYQMLPKPSGYFGYYSTNSVCISKIFVTTADRAWPYTLFVVILNFAAFIYVTLMYLVIYRISTLSGKNVNATPNAQTIRTNKEMQRKIMRLIFTDFCCWVPLSVMTLVHFGGIPLPSVAYVVSAVVLLPINSAINPLVYSTVLDKLRERVIKLLPASMDRQRQVSA